MLLTLIENTKLKRYLIKNNDRVHLDFFCIKIFYKEDKYYMKAINNYFFSDGSYQKVIKDGFFELKNDDLLYEVKVHIILCLEKYEYHFLNTQKFLSFSSCKNSSIILLNKDDKFFNIENGFIKSNFVCFLNGKKYQNEKLNNFDVVDFDVYRLIYNKRICLFSKYLSLLNVEFKKPKVVSELKIKNMDYKYKYYPEVEKPNLKLKLKDYPIINKKDQKAIFLTLGPMFTMSFVSLLLAILNAFLASEKGRSLIEILPIIIFPAAMFVSLLLWQTINHFYEKNFIKKEEIKNKNEYDEYLKTIEKQIISFNNKMNEYYDSLSLTMDNLKDIETNGKLYFTNIDQKRLWFVNIGKGKRQRDNLDIVFDSEQKDPNALNLLKKFVERHKKIKDDLIFIDLIKYKFITINLLNDRYLFYYIYAQLCFKINTDDLKFAVYIKEKRLEEFSFFLKDEHFIYDDRRLIFTKNTKINIDEKKLVIFVFDEDFVTNYLDNAIYIFVYFDKKISKKSNALIICNNFNGNFICNDCNFNFYYEPFDLNFYNFFRKIESYNLKNSFFIRKKITFKDVYSNVEIPKNSLIAYLGYDEDGKVVSLDLSEKVDGPHGLIAGSTGSGKSVLILNICLSLAYNYSPDYLNLAIIDFKGGGVIHFLKNNNLNLPHLVSSMSNIDNIDYRRILASFRYECIKRQMLFKKLSSFIGITINDIDDYMRYYDDRYELDKKAHLVIIIDEFAEVKDQFPDFIKEVVSIARVGRSLGIHLILSTQRPNGIIDDQIRSNINFKICLRVNDKQDSKEVIDSDKAYFLKEVGSFYLVANKIIKKGYSMYCNSDINNSNLLKADLLSYDLSPYKTKFINTKNIVLESDLIVKNIMNRYKDFENDIYSLWLNEPFKIKISQYLKGKDEKVDNIVIGICDDYENKKQYLAKIDYRENTLIYSLNEESKKKIMNTIIYSCYKMSNFFDTIIINFSTNNFDDYKNICGIKEIINKEERLNYLLRVLIKRPDKIEKPLLIIIDNLHSFNILNDENFKKIKFLLQVSLEYKFKFLFFSNNLSDINYRCISFIKQKVVISDVSSDDFLTIFNKKKQNLIGDEQGYYKKQKFLKFNLFLREKFNYKKDYSELKYFKKTILIPKIIVKDQYILFGIDADFYEPFYINILNDLIITGFDLDVANEIYLKISNLLQDKKDKISLIMFDDLYSKYEKEKIFNKNILFVGTGINKQFLFSNIDKKELLSNEAFYFFKDKGIKIIYDR